ncbi:hypothetical protein BST95_03445 [Halioglobus japonicus]|uniref:Sugar kinase n=1 Tax=Halioglobus japonicus TaxID=930805 RepID=A0AAP8MD41_9GAMM|nr:sugar kinase [Halioglobus japonicus]AQA17430.1 hypothetical protein BST95_03445 [Halioglobus japonicus]PLW85354.1 sugar kinase [Halioglobus japonicus]GHD22170.1 2-dehydro-3-deoxygluconokinase [Halioglobus japonicus]
MRDLVIFGECMVELSYDEQGQLQQGFAGDVYSVSVYLRRANPDTLVRMLCALGDDPFSNALRIALADEGVNTSLLLSHPERHVGLYSIHNGAAGERSFIYRRSESAARHTLQLVNEQQLNLADPAPDCFYLSGISLALAEAETPGAIWPMLDALKARGTQIIFDTNYRPRLWSSQAAAQAAFDRMLSYSDLVLPGVEDLELLNGLTHAASIGAYLHDKGVATMVLKNGPADILYGDPLAPAKHVIAPVANVVDTTAAGDSFSGTLLGELAAGKSLAEAVAAGQTCQPGLSSTAGRFCRVKTPGAFAHQTPRANLPLNSVPDCGCIAHRG